MKNKQVETYLQEQLGVERPQVWREQSYAIDPVMSRKVSAIVQESDVVFILGDYDTDGICSSKILKDGLRAMYPNKTISVLLPDRFQDGYGMNPKQIDKIKHVLQQMDGRGKGFTNPCIMTCDNGTSCKEVIAYAKEQMSNLKVIITDHHLPTIPTGKTLEEVLPNADVICNPHLGGFAYQEYCGAGVALRIMQSLGMPDGAKLDELKIYAGIATVADMVEIREDNWVIVRESLALFRAKLQQRNLPPALQMICDSLGVKHPSQVNEGWYGFTASPLFNAMGRLQNYGANQMFRFLDNEKPTQDMCDTIIENNQTRKAIVNQVYETLMDARSVKENDGIKPIWLYIPQNSFGAEEGLCGLYATKIVEAMHVPTIVVTPSRVDPTILKGSGRSIPGFDLHTYLKEVASPYLLGFGGHKEACGLSVTMEQLKALSKDPNLYKRDPYFHEEDLMEQEIPVFADRLSDMVADYKELQESYAPFGPGFQAPLYEVTCDNEQHEFRTMGEGKHFYTMMDAIKCVHFHHDTTQLQNADRFSLQGRISENYYKGNVTYQFLAESISDDVRELERDMELA